MEGSFNSKERRGHPRVFIDLPIEYQDMGDPCLRGAIVVNASDRGFLIEALKDISVGTELSITVLVLARYSQLPDTGAVQGESWTSSKIVILESPPAIATFQIVITP